MPKVIFTLHVKRAAQSNLGCRWRYRFESRSFSRLSVWSLSGRFSSLKPYVIICVLPIPTKLLQVKQFWLDSAFNSWFWSNGELKPFCFELLYVFDMHLHLHWLGDLRACSQIYLQRKLLGNGGYFANVSIESIFK